MKVIFALLFVFFATINLYSQNVTIDTAGVYKINALLQVPPKFPGDINQWAARNILYSSSAHGEVYMSFVIEDNGVVSTIRVLGSFPPDISLENEATRIIHDMPTWKPGMQNGKPVSVIYSLGIKFREK
jgi:TonB-like protein